MKKIMFNDKFGLTKAVLEGRKTMTRRIVRNPKEVEINSHKYLQTEKLRYKVGDVVAVAQAYKDTWGNPDFLFADKPGWNNKMFVRAKYMPHQVRITNIRIERLQDISDEDCLREGIREKNDFPHKKSFPYYFDGGKHSWDNSFSTPRKAFAALIDKVSGKGTWESNPWVFVYEFELEK